MDSETKTLTVCYYLEETRQLIILANRKPALSELSRALRYIEEAMKLIGCST